MLGIYSLGINNIVFVAVNFGAALLSAAVVASGGFMKIRNGDRTGEEPEQETDAEASRQRRSRRGRRVA